MTVHELTDLLLSIPNQSSEVVIRYFDLEENESKTMRVKDVVFSTAGDKVFVQDWKEE